MVRGVRRGVAVCAADVGVGVIDGVIAAGVSVVVVVVRGAAAAVGDCCWLGVCCSG